MNDKRFSRRAISRLAPVLPLICLALFSVPASARAPLVLLTDFGTQDGAVSAMKGVAYGVSQDLLISDLSHENPSIFVGAYRLYQAEQFWPAGTVFVAVVEFTWKFCKPAVEPSSWTARWLAL